MSGKRTDSKEKLTINLDLTTCVHDLIEEQVAKSPDSIAVIFDNQKYTYRELNNRANQLANHLQQLGLKPEMLVGICLARSFEMVAGILGILKAGGAFLPLDAAYPSERLQFILEDAGAQFLLTQADLLSVLPREGKQIICLDKGSSEISRQSEARPQPVALAENLAYVIYTSGSTGKPKGVMITHANLCSFVRIACSALDVRSKDVYLHTASIAYALSIRQLMVPLSYGATVVVASANQTRDPLLLFDLIKRCEISLMDVVPSFWRTCIQRLSDLPPDELKNLLDNSLRRIVSIGEPLFSDIPRDWRFKLSHCADLVNIFGQTETTGVVATYHIPEDVQNSTGIVPIGHNVPETILYILDSDLRPVPVGETGELCVSNPCLARGYLNHPELTTAKFIPNPFNDQCSGRLYRTGDLARRRDDGNIEFLGRGDYQVKIRGQRLELGEVESILREHPAVKDCVIVALGEYPLEKYLLAYIVLAPGQRIVHNKVGNYMRQRVPDYMVPSDYVILDALPLTPNGKVDRLALAGFSNDSLRDRSKNNVMYRVGAEVSTQFRSQTERAIARIWQDLLKIDSFKQHDNFFDLGGHSLMAVRMFSRIEKDLGVRLPLTSLFHASTVAELAELIEHGEGKLTNWTPVVPIRTLGIKPPFFGIHGHEGGVLFWRDLVAQLPDDQPFYAIQAQGVDGVKPALMSINTMATLYLEEIRKVQPHGPYYIGGYSMGGEIALEVAQQFFKKGEQVGLLVMFDTANPVRSISSSIFENEGSPTSIHKMKSHNDKYRLLRRKILYHIKRLSERRLREKLGYILIQTLHHIKVFAIFTSVKMFRMLNKRLPDPLLLRYLRESHSKALHSYMPVVYPGKITLFRASQSVNANPDDSPTGWKPLAGGGFEAHHFTATHDIMNEEYAIEVAEKLNECLVNIRGY